jgi:hypothetical protein
MANTAPLAPVWQLDTVSLRYLYADSRAAAEQALFGAVN